MSRQLHVEERSRRPAGDDARERLLAGMPVTERRLELAGISTAVLEGGDGPPVVLLHGPGEFAATWMRAIPDLVRTYRIVAPDLPGHGASEVADDSLDADRVFAWLGELIEHTCSSPPALVGHLLGSAIAARFASDQGERVSRLVLVDAYGLGWLRPAPRFALAMIGFLARPTERTQDRLFRGCFVDLDGLREQIGERWEPLAAYALDRARTPNQKIALRSLMPQLGVPPIPPAELARIAVPTTLIWGRHDLQVRLRIAEAASARYGWPLHIIEGARDDPAFEQPAAFLKALHTALDSSWPTTAKEESMTTRDQEQTRGVGNRFAAGSDEFATPVTNASQNQEVTGVSQQYFGKGYSGSVAENYERFFAPAIGAPLAADLIDIAALRPGERVLDVACGTGVVARLAAERVGDTGAVAGLDLNPGMLAVARSVTPSDMVIDWHEASAEAMPLPNESFDIVLCQLGLQFVPDKLAALQEMRRVLAPGGRLIMNVVGPTPPLFAIAEEAFARHIGPEAAGFMRLVFSLHDPDELQDLTSGAGFHDVAVWRDTKTLRLPAPEEFLWQYVHSTPLAAAVAQADDESRAALESNVVAKWQEFVEDGALILQPGIVVATARK